MRATNGSRSSTYRRVQISGATSQGQYGERVKAWMVKMTEKAIDGSWNIGVGAAGTLLAEGLKAFFGW